MILNVDMVYKKFLVLNTIYNFVVENFFNLKSFRVTNMCFKFIDFEIQNLEFINDFECSRIVNTNKVVVVDLIYMFVVNKFLI